MSMDDDAASVKKAMIEIMQMSNEDLLEMFENLLRKGAGRSSTPFIWIKIEMKKRLVQTPQGYHPNKAGVLMNGEPEIVDNTEEKKKNHPKICQVHDWYEKGTFRRCKICGDDEKKVHGEWMDLSIALRWRKCPDCSSEDVIRQENRPNWWMCVHCYTQWEQCPVCSSQMVEGYCTFCKYNHTKCEMIKPEEPHKCDVCKVQDCAGVGDMWCEGPHDVEKLPEDVRERAGINYTKWRGEQGTGNGVG